jgi:ribosome-binding factor A
MSVQSTRVRRVERELFELLSQFLIKDFAGLLPGYASITAVEVTPDLRSARVFFRVVGPAEITAATESVLSGERGRFQKAVSRGIKLKFCPVLKFEFGHVKEQDEIDVLLENLNKPKNFGD